MRTSITTSSLPRMKTLEDVLAVLQQLIGIRFKIKGNVVFIKLKREERNRMNKSKTGKNESAKIPLSGV